MNCMKCGKETQEGSAFCEACLADMRTVPIKPGTPVYIPRQAPRRPARKKETPPEERIEALQKRIRRLWRAIIALALALALTAAGLVWSLWPEPEKPEEPPHRPELHRWPLNVSHETF